MAEYKTVAILASMTPEELKAHKRRQWRERTAVHLAKEGNRERKNAARREVYRKNKEKNNVG
jgi:hypothetical protein